jgi:hypothetical protein
MKNVGGVDVSREGPRNCRILVGKMSVRRAKNIQNIGREEVP